jgi:hypothetical protein
VLEPAVLAKVTSDLRRHFPRLQFAVEYGERLDNHVTAFATLTYFNDLMTDRMRSNLTRANAMLAASTGSTWTLQGRDQGLALSVGGGAVFLIRYGLRVNASPEGESAGFS